MAFIRDGKVRPPKRESKIYEEKPVKTTEPGRDFSPAEAEVYVRSLLNYGLTRALSRALEGIGSEVRDKLRDFAFEIDPKTEGELYKALKLFKPDGDATKLTYDDYLKALDVIKASVPPPEAMVLSDPSPSYEPGALIYGGKVKVDDAGNVYVKDPDTGKWKRTGSGIALGGFASAGTTIGVFGEQTQAGASWLQPEVSSNADVGVVERHVRNAVKKAKNKGRVDDSDQAFETVRRAFDIAKTEPPQVKPCFAVQNYVLQLMFSMLLTDNPEPPIDFFWLLKLGLGVLEWVVNKALDIIDAIPFVSVKRTAFYEALVAWALRRKKLLFCRKVMPMIDYITDDIKKRINNKLKEIGLTFEDIAVETDLEKRKEMLVALRGVLSSMFYEGSLAHYAEELLEIATAESNVEFVRRFVESDAYQYYAKTNPYVADELRAFAMFLATAGKLPDIIPPQETIQEFASLYSYVCSKGGYPTVIPAEALVFVDGELLIKVRDKLKEVKTATLSADLYDVYPDPIPEFTAILQALSETYLIDFSNKFESMRLQIETMARFGRTLVERKMSRTLFRPFDAVNAEEASGNE